MATTHREPPSGIETAILQELRLLPRRAQEAYLDEQPCFVTQL
jgi:hypothetical protein